MGGHDSIGTTVGFNPGLVAGMILSGACCGDKFSPLSDSTNLAAASAQTGLFDHVRAMTTTTFPILLLPIVLIVVVALCKMPALSAVLLVSGVGCVFAVIFQGATFTDCITMLHYGYSAETGNELYDELVNRGGMDSMLWTNNLVIIAVGFGGILHKIGAVEAIVGSLVHKVKKPFHLIIVTMLTAIFCITTMCDQYLGLIIPATMYKDRFDELGLARNLLSRTMEDSGTLWSPLVPWSSCGAYHAATLGVPTLQYVPFCFMNIINPIYALITASWGGNILYADGTRTTLFGRRLKQGPVAQAPEDAHEKAMAALAEIRGEKK